MSDIFTAVIEGLRGVMASAWPEVVPNGIWRSEEALMRSYERELALPYAIIDLPRWPASDRDGITNRAWRAPFSLYYVAETEGDFDALSGKLAALAEALEAGLPAGQIIPPNVTPSTGQEVAGNAMLVLLNATQRAGGVTGTLAVGVTRA